MTEWNLGEYVIRDEEDGLVWYSFTEGDESLFFKGFCFVSGRCLILADWEETGAFEELEFEIVFDNKWDKTDFYALVTSSGNLNIYKTDSLEEAGRDETAEIASAIGCTMKYR